MTMFRSLLAGLAAGLWLAAQPLSAAIYAVTPLPGANPAVGVVDVDNLGLGLASATNCCAAQSGTLTLDSVNHVAYFIDNAADGQYLVRYRYAAPAYANRLALGNALRITHLEWDALHNRLVGVARDSLSEQLELFKIEGKSLVVLASLPPDCCELRAGVSAFSGIDNTLYLIGKASGGGEQLLAFSFTSLSQTAALDLAGESVADLVLDDTTLYALGHDATSGNGHLLRISITPSLSLSVIRSGAADCCYVLAGSAVIDHASNSLAVLARGTDAAGAFLIRRANLDSGAITTGNALNAFGLFEDNVAVTDLIFRDGFQ